MVNGQWQTAARLNDWNLFFLVTGTRQLAPGNSCTLQPATYSLHPVSWNPETPVPCNLYPVTCISR